MMGDCEENPSSELGNLGNRSNEIDFVEEGHVCGLKCESSCSEKSTCEMGVSETEIFAAESLLMMANGVSDLRKIDLAMALNNATLNSGLVTDVGDGDDDDEIDGNAHDGDGDECPDSLLLKSFLDRRTSNLMKRRRKCSRICDVYGYFSNSTLVIGGAEHKYENLGLGSNRSSLVIHQYQRKRRKRTEKGGVFHGSSLREKCLSELQEEPDEGDENKEFNLLRGDTKIATTSKIMHKNGLGESVSFELENSSVGLNIDPRKQKLDENGISAEKFTNEELKCHQMHPNFHEGFSFSIIHLLSAIRRALVTPYDNGSNKQREQHSSNENAYAKRSGLTIDEIVQHVRSNPGHLGILQTQAPIIDLIKGALRIFSSEIAPLGVKCWKPLTAYQKHCKCWYWVGPASPLPFEKDDRTLGALTSPAAWGLPSRTMLKLVDSFDNWLKIYQEALKLLGTLHKQPQELTFSIMNPKERFKGLTGKNCEPTINPSFLEVKAYFQREERIRYMIPERAFAYTAVDGRKSTVAPLTKCRGKVYTTARDHHLLKPDRPGSITILTVVRDAAARLPGGVGTRGDVCVLIRDSQHIREAISDEELNQIASRGLDRLHYEVDPCVKYDKGRKLWAYLHGDRKEEDFEVDGRRSTIKRKNQRLTSVETP